MPAERDLLGDRMRPYRDPRGRKKFKNTNALREHVAILAAGGLDRQDIADAIGCCEKTLRAHFLPELNQGKASKRGEAIAKLWELGMGGSVPALKAFLSLAEKGDSKPRMPAPAKAPKLGKKEQADLEARNAHRDTSWGRLLDTSESMH